MANPLHLQRINQRRAHMSMTMSERRRVRARPPAGRSMWIPLMLGMVLLASLPSVVQSQLTLETCREKMIRGDKNNDGVLSKVEYINFLVSASPYGPSCPDLKEIGDFLSGGKYSLVLEIASCYCQEYDTDSTCCGTPSLRVDDAYPTAYTERVCSDISDIIESSCNPPPTGAPTDPPTQAIITRPESSAPTTSPTQAPTANGTQDGSSDEEPLNLPRYTEKDDTPFRPLPYWMRIALPFACVAFVASIFLFADFHRQNKRKRQIAAKGFLSDEEEDDDNDSLSGYPEILEATEIDETERSMEEGRLAEVQGQKNLSWRENLPPPKSPQRMSKFLDTLDLEQTAAADPPAKKKKKKKSANNDAASADSDRKMSEFVDTLDREKKDLKALGASRTAPAPADAQERMGGFFRDTASASDASASSTEFFYDENEDDASADSGTTESSAQIKWRLLHPTTLVSTGAVEVFPLPPIVTGYVASSSSSSPPSSPDSGESKEEENDEDSVSDLYVAEDDSQEFKESQPDPDGMRLEDGRQYREQWQADSRK